MKMEKLHESLRLGLYNEANLKSIGFPAREFRQASEVELCDLHINLDQCFNQGGQAQYGILYCDVLSVDDVVLIDRPVLIIARRIEMAPGAEIVVSSAGGAQGELRLWSQELYETGGANDPTLNISLINQDMQESAIQWKANGVEVKGLFVDQYGFQYPDERAIDPALMFIGSPLHFHLQAVSTMSIMRSDDYPPLAIAQLSWTYYIARHHQLTADLASQAMALMLDIPLRQVDDMKAMPVPPLDHQIYADSAKSMKDLLLARQGLWNRIQDQTERDQNSMNMLQLALRDHQEQLELAKKLELQADRSRIETIFASGQAGGQLKQSKQQLDAAGNMFSVGIKHWEEDKTIDAVFDLVVEGGKLLMTAASVVSGLPPMGAGGGKVHQAGNLPNGGTNSPIPHTVDDSSDGPWYDISLQSDNFDDWEFISIPSSPDNEKMRESINTLVDKAADGIEAIAGVAKAALAIYKVSAMARKMEDVGLKIFSSAEAQVSAELSQTSLHGLGLITGGEDDWLRLENGIQLLFDAIGEDVLSQINGGLEYRFEFKQMMVAAKSLCQARLAVARATAQCADLILRRQSAETMLKYLQQHMRTGEEAMKTKKALLPAAFIRLIDAKRSVYIALRSYRQALAYFTLLPQADLPSLPRISDNIDSFCSAVAVICGKELSLKALRLPPQSMNDVELFIDDAHRLGILRAQQCIQINLDPSHPAFDGFTRIRLGRFRVFLDGLETTGDIKASISSSGIYSDRNPNDEIVHFIANPLRKNFQYDAETQLVRYDGDIAPRYREDFFMPTPFSGWQFMFTHQSGKPLDLTKVRGLRLVFSGEATALAE